MKKHFSMNSMVCLVQSEAYSNLIEYYYSNITNESYNKNDIAAVIY